MRLLIDLMMRLESAV